MNWITQIDVSILLFIQENIRSEAMNGFWKFITSLGDLGWFWIALSIALMIPKKTRKVGIASLISLLLGVLITNVTLKNLIARTRPFDLVDAIVPLIAKPHDFSFPSGHTCASFASALILYRMLPKKYGVPAVILAAMIGLSRLYVGVHYPTDVIGGFLAALLASTIVYYGMKKWEARKNEKRKVSAQGAEKPESAGVNMGGTDHE